MKLTGIALFDNFSKYLVSISIKIRNELNKNTQVLPPNKRQEKK